MCVFSLWVCTARDPIRAVSWLKASLATWAHQLEDKPWAEVWRVLFALQSCPTPLPVVSRWPFLVCSCPEPPGAQL